MKKFCSWCGKEVNSCGAYICARCWIEQADYDKNVWLYFNPTKISIMKRFANRLNDFLNSMNIVF